jgi:outer membrane biosynthesis protein TonB
MMEQTKERRKLALAILISLFLHFAVAYSLAAFSGALSSTLPLDDKPVELTIVDLSATPPPLVAKDPPFLETAPSKETAEKPKEQTFESNANSIAATELPATGDAPLPTQKGKERPAVNLETHDYSLPSEGSKPQPDAQSTVAPESKPQPAETTPPKATAAEAPDTTPEAEKFAMLTSTPPPPIKAPDETESSPPPVVESSVAPAAPRPKPELPASNYQAQKEKTRINGSLSNRGPSSVNAVGTPLGRYQKAVSEAIGSRWYYYMNSKMDLVSIGTAHLQAEVDAQGRIQKLRVVSNNANEAFANICLQSFQEAHIPPIPPDLIATLPEGRMPVDFSFTAYANQ